MSFLTNVLTAILGGYVAVTMSMANAIETHLFPQDRIADSSEQVSNQDEETGERLSFLPGALNAIPDILLRSGAYQQAALQSAPGLTGGTAPEPLDAIVNILCTFTTEESIRTTTGTGFFIDPDGVIMTNAHVAQFLLMEEVANIGDAKCVVRNGDPAAPRYTAELLYIPPAWIQENAGIINDAVPMGTGERDYALLYVNSHIDETPLPTMFPALDFDANLLPISMRGADVTAAGYPATNLLENGPSAALSPQQANTNISELYTFGSNYADVISIRGSAVGAEGASGGPIINETGDVIGMIVTRGDDTTDGEGSLRAITLSHVDRTIRQETGFTLNENLNGNLSYRAEIFANTLSPFLINILERAN